MFQGEQFVRAEGSLRIFTSRGHEALPPEFARAGQIFGPAVELFLMQGVFLPGLKSRGIVQCCRFEEEPSGQQIILPSITIKPVKDSAMLPGYARVAAEFTYGLGRKDRLWIDVPASCVPEIGDLGNTWLLAMLPLAFRTGRRLKVCAPVDPVLLRNAAQIMRIWSQWFPSLHPVPIEGEASSAQAGAGRRTGLFFTGGVDSFFSALHYDERVRSGALTGVRPVDDLIFVWGFDLPLKSRAEFERKQRRLADAARELGKNLITVVTNFRETRLRKLDWGLRTHGAALGAVGLLLGKRFDKILLSSTFLDQASIPWGSHRLVDPLMSTGQTKILHYGADIGRFEKTAFISRSEAALRYLHVCWEDGTDRNCGKCEKCYRTLLSLELLGLRGKAASFPPGQVSLDQMKTVWKNHTLVVGLYLELRNRALELSRPDVVKAIDECLALPDAQDRTRKFVSRWERLMCKCRRYFQRPAWGV